MNTVAERLSKLEAAQHFQQAIVGALAKACADHPNFMKFVHENLALHHAVLLGDSTDEVKVKAFEELMTELLGKSGTSPSS